MKSPKALLQEYLLIPVYQFQKNYVSKSALHSVCNKFSNFVFKKSDDMPLILLFFNSVSIISSHIAQINGLKKSKRENKDYLITQEWKEFGLDMLFTVIPPFMLKNFLEKKFYSGEWTTKSARNYLIDTIAPTVGAAREELYNTSHIKPLRESLGSVAAQITNRVKKIDELPKYAKKIINFVEKNPYVKLSDPNKAIPMASMKEIAVDFDKIRQNKFKGFYNGSAYDEIIGQMEGMTILATLAYTIVASSIITPILKNKLANRSYQKQLEKMGETPESLKRKKRFEYTSTPLSSETSVFGVFSHVDESVKPLARPINIQPLPELKNNPFSEFRNVAGLKI